MSLNTNTNAFVVGLGQMFDFNGDITRANVDRVINARNSHSEAIYSYWQNVGGYIKKAMNEQPANQRPA
ncbi:hypothetical protein RsTz2092_09650 [Deferribacterales bacterium RsTz2092]|nr:hypothetical protein AGMMS49941_06320 [Deferribacterales bacterium]GHU85871.1 hypothetical protein AGMMS49941_06450 [Deferribacterales bacterium]